MRTSDAKALLNSSKYLKIRNIRDSRVPGGRFLKFLLTPCTLNGTCSEAVCLTAAIVSSWWLRVSLRQPGTAAISGGDSRSRRKSFPHFQTRNSVILSVRQLAPSTPQWGFQNLRLNQYMLLCRSRYTHQVSRLPRRVDPVATCLLQNRWTVSPTNHQ